MFVRAQLQSTRLRRLTAVAAIGLLLILGVLAVRPDLHEKLHADAHQANHECAVMLFSGGVPAPLPMLAVVAPSEDAAEPLPSPVDRQVPATARYLQPPGRDPPAGLS